MRFPAGPPPSKAWLLLLLLPGIGAFFGAYVLLAPTTLSYRVEPAQVVVEARLGRMDDGTVIRRSDILEAKRVRVSGASRRHGTSIAGYCAGAWTLGEIGDVTMATDCRADVVAIQTRAETVVISPDAPDTFLALLRDPAGVGTFDVPPTDRPAWLTMLAVAIAAVPLGLAALFLRIFQGITYRVEGGALVVPRHFGELTVPLRGVIVRPGSLHRAIRVAGTGMPGFWMGRYRDREGGFHACGSRRADGWMVEGPRRVYVTPQDADGFLAALSAAGALVQR